MIRALVIGAALAALGTPAIAGPNGDKIPDKVLGRWCYEAGLREDDVYVRNDKCESDDLMKLSQTDKIGHESGCKNVVVKNVSSKKVRVYYVPLSRKRIAFDIKQECIGSEDKWNSRSLYIYDNGKLYIKPIN